MDTTDYCRRVEEHLTRVNGGHLVRIVGPAFDLVRGWAADGVPLSVVYRGIEAKAARHARGTARRPLRIEFCADDVRETYAAWRRAIGAPSAASDGTETPDEAPSPAASAPARPPSIARHVARVADRLGGLLGRMDLPAALRDSMSQVIVELGAVRERAARARGAARDELVARLAELDAGLAQAARAAAPPDLLRAVEAEAASELQAFRDRLSPVQWQAALGATVDRLLRDRYRLPVLHL